MDSKGLSEYERPSASSYSTLSFSLYGELIKTKQTFLLVYTSVFAYLISSWSEIFILSNLLWLIVGMILAVSGSTLLNMYIDRDIDAKMERTKDRALPSGKIPPSTVLKHGILFTLAGTIAIGIFVNVLTATIVALGFFFDVIIYSMLLKRRTKLSIIFGGIAGGLPAMAGRTAALEVLDLTAVLMGLFVVCWIPLHILTLALIPKNLEGYRNAGVPMWPVVSSRDQTIRVITLSAILSALLIIATGATLKIDIILMTPLIIFSGYILYHAITNMKNPNDKQTFKIFKLASLFMALAFFLLFFGIVGTSFLP